MKIARRSVWAAYLVLGMLTMTVGLVLTIVSFFTGDTAWRDAGNTTMTLAWFFYLPVAYRDFVQVRAQITNQPKPSPRRLLTRWPLLLLPFMLLPLFGWLVWLAFGRVWMGALVAFGMGLPIIALLASTYLMEPGSRKNRVNLACIVAGAVIPVLMIVVFTIVYGMPER